MEFAVISPTAGLRRYSSLSKYHLILPQVQDPDYTDFYIQDDGFHILDNGAYEGKNDWRGLLNMARVYQPHVLVLPDYLLQDWEKTWDEARRFMDSFDLEDMELMYVPQSTPQDQVGYIMALSEALQDERIKWIGLSRALPLKIAHDPLARVRITEYLRKYWPHIKVHALGMMNGNLAELALLRKAGCYGCDSSCAVWRGWNGYDLRDPQWPDIPVQFDCPAGIPSEKHELILQNLEVLFEHATGTRPDLRKGGKEISGGESDRKQSIVP